MYDVLNPLHLGTGDVLPDLPSQGMYLEVYEADHTHGRLDEHPVTFDPRR
jgi:hypothetical protein